MKVEIQDKDIRSILLLISGKASPMMAATSANFLALPVTNVTGSRAAMMNQYAYVGLSYTDLLDSNKDL